MFRTGLWLHLLVMSVSAAAAAQQISRQEVTTGWASSSDTPNGGTLSAGYGQVRIGLDGPIVRYTFNANRWLAVESSITQSTDGVAVNDHEGGHQLLAMGGIKAGLRWRKFGVFGTVDAGVASFSKALQAFSAAGPAEYGHTTHFAWQQGVALEWYPKPRNFLRFDFAELLEAEFQRVYYAPNSLTRVSYGVVPYHAFAALSVGHRFGALKDVDEPAPRFEKPKYSVGGLFNVEMREHLLLQNLRAEGGGGAWVGVPLWRFVSADIIAYDHPHDDHTAYPQDGGTTFASFAGPKVGFRLGQFGLYAKGRPGIMRFSRTNFYQDGLTATGAPIVGNRPTIDFALDTGGVLEYTPPERALRHLVARFEGGSTYIHYHGSNLTSYRGPSEGFETFYYPPQRHSSLLFQSGLGFTF